MDQKISDADQRELAIDAGRSFIVQAPAGSGKTELLIQRYLNLLSRVDWPEEIIAITFTRKAAAEMKSRILAALARATNQVPPHFPHEIKTWELARAALANNNQRSWMLTENPLRLKIQTIDAFCAGLTRQMPMISGFGGEPGITETPDALYQQAARATIADLESGLTWSPAIENLIRHLDNHLEKVEHLIAGMLSKRDQWLRHTADPDPRQALEKSLQHVIQDALDAVRRLVPDSRIQDIADLARFAAGHIRQWDVGSPIGHLHDLQGLPEADSDEIPKWLGVADLFLTKEGQWRKTASKNTGFPAPSASKSGSPQRALYQQKKKLFEEVVSELSCHDMLADALHHVRLLPEPRYSDVQWHIMEALFEILRVAVGHLEAVFSETGQVDFAEIAMRANQALGEPEAPTDLTLALDYRIRHILVDEFQDTSFTQYALFEKLTAGWEPSDGRTFFAVGDPMQSIYGFREAEVGLFMKARNRGLGHVKLYPITLSVNFRSQENIVRWINHTFPHVMPRAEDETTGAVSFTPSVARHTALEGDGVTVLPMIPSDSQKEADAVVRIIQDVQAKAPHEKIAVLVRSRTHLEFIIGSLKTARIAFRAVEIESLKSKPVIMDLISLTRALSHPADRIAWLAVLRAPWCGLLLKDLYVLTENDKESPILDLMQDQARIEKMTDDGRTRLLHVREILWESLLNRQRKTLRRQVESAWIALGGPACLSALSEMDDVAVFLDLLDQQVGSGPLTDISALEAAASNLFARPDAQSDGEVEIMTIHKAKGLEFDTVILPGLEKTPPAPAPQLLLWLEKYWGPVGELLLAPIAETGGTADKIYNYLRLLQEKKKAFEDARLLYVAATRAKKRLYLMAGVDLDASGMIRPPRSKSLLAKLWPGIKDQFDPVKINIQAQHNPEKTKGLDVPVPGLRRFKSGFLIPKPPEPTFSVNIEALLPEDTSIPEMPLFDWAGEVVRRSGIVIHQWLKMICEDGIAHWPAERILNHRQSIRQGLALAHIPPEYIEEATENVVESLVKTVTHPRGVWILSKHDRDACEYPLTGRIRNRIVHVVLDRTFMDDTGVTWIIDYKSGTHGGGSKDAFLDQEVARYAGQMALYAQLMSARTESPLMLGLYFPRMQGWRAWKFE